MANTGQTRRSCNMNQDNSSCEFSVVSTNRFSYRWYFPVSFRFLLSCRLSTEWQFSKCPAPRGGNARGAGTRPCNISQHLATITICIDEYRYVMVTRYARILAMKQSHSPGIIWRMPWILCVFLTMPLVRRSWRSCQHLTSLVSTCFNTFDALCRFVSCWISESKACLRPDRMPGCPPLNCQQSKLHQAVERR